MPHRGEGKRIVSQFQLNEGLIVVKFDAGGRGSTRSFSPGNRSAILHTFLSPRGEKKLVSMERSSNIDTMHLRKFVATNTRIAAPRTYFV